MRQVPTKVIAVLALVVALAGSVLVYIANQQSINRNRSALRAVARNQSKIAGLVAQNVTVVRGECLLRDRLEKRFASDLKLLQSVGPNSGFQYRLLLINLGDQQLTVDALSVIKCTK